ncbi:MAG: FKBP-type peptidyl-prolyl cis-trans isomerase [Thermoanaerobaculia bacterium]
MRNQKATPIALILLLVLALTAQVEAQDSIPAPPDVAAPPADAAVTASGLVTKVIEPGTGTEHPGATDLVQVHYTGWTTDGKMFDSSVVRGEPIGLPLDAVISGWTEGVQLMVVGEKRRFWIPEELAYGGQPGKPAGMLVFDVELLRFQEREKPPNPPTAPPDVSGPPSDADFTKSGLASKVLEAGTGTEHPTLKSNVTVHYSGWTTDGKLFDSSVVRGEPATFPLDRVISGWTQGLQLMVVGEKRRFWIPEELAYQGTKPPFGMLVFDVELISFDQ